MKENTEYITYVTNKWAPSFMTSLVSGDSIDIGQERGPDLLKELEDSGDDLRVCIPEKSVLNALRKQSGAKLDHFEERVSLVPGRRVLLVRPSGKVSDYKSDEDLPEFITFKIKPFTASHFEK